MLLSLELNKQACPAPRTSLSAGSLRHQRQGEKVRAKLEYALIVDYKNQGDNLGTKAKCAPLIARDKETAWGQTQHSSLFFVLERQRDSPDQISLEREGGGGVPTLESDEDSQSGRN